MSGLSQGVAQVQTSLYSKFVNKTVF